MLQGMCYIHDSDIKVHGDLCCRECVTYTTLISRSTVTCVAWNVLIHDSDIKVHGNLCCRGCVTYTTLISRSMVTCVAGDVLHTRL